MAGSPQLKPELSPDDLSSPNPEQDAPLLQAQQRSPSRAEKQDPCPKSDIDRTEAGAVTEGVDIEKSAMRKNGRSEEGRIPEKDSEMRTEETEFVNKEAEDGETADEGLPPSKGSGDESEEGSEGAKEPLDDSPETPNNDQDEFIDIPESPEQVGSKRDTASLHVVTLKSSLFSLILCSSLI